MRKPGILPPAELCCSVVAARRPTDLPTLFLKVGIAVSLRVFYTTGFIFQSYEIKCNYRHFRPDLWLFADVILWVKGKFAAACRGGSYFGETGSFVAGGLKNPGFSEAEDMVGESTASGVVQCPGATGLEKCMRAGVGDGFVRSDNKRKATEFAGLYGIGNIESSVSFSQICDSGGDEKSPGGLCQDQFFELFHLSLKSLVRFDLVRYRLAGVQHRGVVASSDSRTDGDQRGFGVLLGQVHGDLTRLSHFAGSFGRIEALDVDMQEVADDFDDVLDCDLFLAYPDIDLQNLLDERQGNFLAHIDGIGYQGRQSALDFPDVGGDIVRQVADDFVRKLEAEFLSLDSDDLDFGVVVGRVELGRKSPLEAGQQSLFDVLQLHGRFIRGKDQLFACQLQVVEYVEEGVLGAGFSRELLDVVDNQYVDHLVEMDEIRNFAVLVGGLELRLELVHRDVKHLQFGVALPHFVADRLHDVGLAQSGVTVYIQRVERRMARIDRDGHTRRTGQAVALPFDEGCEREFGLSCGSMTIFLRPGMTNGFFIFAVLVWVLNCEIAVVSASFDTGTLCASFLGTA